MDMNNNNKKKISLATIRYAFKAIIWPRKKLLFLGLILILINRASGLVLPGSSKYLIDDVIAKGDVELLYILLVVIAVAVSIQAITSFFLTRLLSVEAQYLITRLRMQVQKHILYLPIKFFDNSKSGELVARIMSDVEGVRNLVGTGFVQMIGGILTSLASFIILIHINFKMTIFVLLPLILFSLISLTAFKYIRPIFRKRWEINAEVTGRLTESLGGIRVIKGFNAEDQEIGIFRAGVEKLFNNIKKSLTATSLVSSAAIFLLGLTSVVIMGIGGKMILQQQLTIGDFFAFILYLGFLITPIIQMSDIGSQITEAFAGLDRMEESLNIKRECEERSCSKKLAEIKGDIVFRNVSFSYNGEEQVLKNISFEAPPGTVTALVGSSGSGKSTIASLVASFMIPKEGTIYIDGNDLSEVDIESYRSQLGVVFQDDFLFSGTIRENILFSAPDATEEQLQRAVKAAHVQEFVKRFDKGLDTLIGERGIKLSGGQRQRVTIARAILADPRILILDEATSNLDTESEMYIQRSLSYLMKGRTTIVIAHRLSTIKKADQILVIENGRVVERGTHVELIKKGKRYFQLHTYQTRI
jgi:ABC-type multidrug transport system fused ATPase/permease subunit